jgi:hypothetical protein
MDANYNCKELEYSGVHKKNAVWWICRAAGNVIPFDIMNDAHDSQVQRMSPINTFNLVSTGLKPNISTRIWVEAPLVQTPERFVNVSHPRPDLSPSPCWTRQHVDVWPIWTVRFQPTDASHSTTCEKMGAMRTKRVIYFLHPVWVNCRGCNLQNGSLEAY